MKRWQRSWKRKIIYNDGATYIGDCENDNQNGKRTEAWPDNDIYVEEYMNGTKLENGSLAGQRRHDLKGNSKIITLKDLAAINGEVEEH